MVESTITLEKIIALAKRRGFIFPTSEIYGGLASSYDYGPLGVELLRNIRNTWWKELIVNRADMVGVDTQILLNPQTWVASGHATAFNDPLVEDSVTHKRYRADHLIENWIESHPNIGIEAIQNPDISLMADIIQKYEIKSPEGNKLLPPKEFNIMFTTAIGVVEGDKLPVYLRGETAQGIFTNFINIINSTRLQLPFGVGQIGKSFRNEITSGQFIFRTLEFEQAEIEYFFDPELTPWEGLFDRWKDTMWRFVCESIGIRTDHLRWRRHSDQERSFYSKETFDLEYNYPFGFKELWGIAYRSDYDLKQHMEQSGKDFRYKNPHTGRTFIPHVIEPAVGVNRIMLMVLCDAYFEDKENQRVILRIKPSLAPYKVAVFPLLKNKSEIVDKAHHLFINLSRKFPAVYDDRGNIGKRYYSQDEIGTPYCVTVDFQSLEDDTVTIRDRDSMKQVRVSISEVPGYLFDYTGE